MDDHFTIEVRRPENEKQLIEVRFQHTNAKKHIRRFLAPSEEKALEFIKIIEAEMESVFRHYVNFEK